MNEPLTVQEAPASYQVMMDSLPVRAGYKQTEVGVIPEDWDAKKLGDLASFCTGPFGSALHKSDYTNDGVPVINPMHINNGQIVPSRSMTITETAAASLTEFRLKPNEVIIGRRGDMGRCAIVRHEQLGWLCGTGSMIVRPSSGVDAEFLQRILSSAAVISAIEETSVGSTMLNLNQATLSGLVIQAPPLPEQRAIATALSDVDALLAAQDKLIAKKRDIKQAAMQQLLTGEQRLPGFSGEWEVKRLGDICGRITTGKLDANAMVASGEYPFFTCAREHYFIDEYAFDADALLVSGNGANVGYVHHYTGKFNAYQRTYVLTNFNAEIVYLRLFMDKNLQERLRTEVNAGNTPYITMDTLTDMSVALPCTREEQSAIATILSDMDADLTALEQQRDKTRALKQGMMQELLTGRIRLV